MGATYHAADVGAGEDLDRILGRTLPDWCSLDAGDREACIVVETFASPIGEMLMGATNEGVCLLEFVERPTLGEQLDRVSHHLKRPLALGGNTHTDVLREELVAYFAGTLRAFSVPLVYPGTSFQVRVWEGLRRIPYGRTLSYDALAHAIGRPNAQRAVGMANRSNRIAIVIPCHRVINKDGGLQGYAGGLWRKQILLDLELGGGSSQMSFAFEA